MSTAIIHLCIILYHFLVLAESNTSFDKESDKDIESKDQSAQSGDHDPIDPLKPSLMPNATDAQILVCCEDILYLFSLNSVIQVPFCLTSAITIIV